MANMSGPGAGDLFDCIWLVKPYSEYQPKSHLLVRIEQLTNLGKSETHKPFSQSQRVAVNDTNSFTAVTSSHKTLYNYSTTHYSLQQYSTSHSNPTVIQLKWIQQSNWSYAKIFNLFLKYFRILMFLSDGYWAHCRVEQHAGSTPRSDVDIATHRNVDGRFRDELRVSHSGRYRFLHSFARKTEQWIHYGHRLHGLRLHWWAFDRFQWSILPFIVVYLAKKDEFFGQKCDIWSKSICFSVKHCQHFGFSYFFVFFIILMDFLLDFFGFSYVTFSVHKHFFSNKKCCITSWYGL